MASAKKGKKTTTSYFKIHHFKTPVTFSTSRFSRLGYVQNLNTVILRGLAPVVRRLDNGAIHPINRAIQWINVNKKKHAIPPDE